MTPPIPYAPGALRVFLVAQEDLTALVPAASVTTRDVPDPIRGPFVTLRGVGGSGDDPLLRTPTVQVDAWAPSLEILGGTTDPEEVAWDIAAMAGQLIGRARNISFRGSAWSGHWRTGIVTAIDKTRGPDQPIYRATIRVDLKMRAART
ncbi:MAG: hypothetical protein JWN03_1188 [Nocardia sp.]|uniref:hypothetical protein n=1 Tax=Nocardia sp. TaxID=1821 RepID=UPI002633C0C9|nr:hypothetical protein [Nocardia sp.]MCU1640913.1 hypothetical protein [Nocardia sp.]